MERLASKKLKNKETGNQGELLIADYLRKQGYAIIGMNYRKQWGEIDVIAQKDDKVHFVEVKTVSYETKPDLELAVLRGTYRPEENVHKYKIKKLARAIETWLAEHNWQGNWQIDVAAVRTVSRETYATMNIISNIVID
ncbi:YraN family protein [Patescibacteria group bacterium]|nr:YraN family protein [Patescibacteria group bacterium]